MRNLGWVFALLAGCFFNFVTSGTTNHWFTVPQAKGTTPPTSSRYLKCRQCNHASSLDVCNRLVACNPTTEACYMDEVVTDQLTVVYNGGCRAKDVCAASSSGIVVGKRADLISCSSCCEGVNDCNSKLCGIKLLSTRSVQCYHCDQSVRHPDDCVTLTTCNSDEMCVSKKTLYGFQFGCFSKYTCANVMKYVFMDYDRCYGTNPNDGMCGASTVNCNACCGDGQCNYGSCKQLKERLYLLHRQGLLDPVTLQIRNHTVSG